MLEAVDDVLADLLGPVGGLEVVAEVGRLRGDPAETPAAAPAVVLDPVDRRARDRREGGVMAGKLPLQPVEMAAELRAARAAVLPVRRKHEVIDDQPPASPEQLAERLPADWRVEGIRLVDRRPGQGA